MNSISVIIGTFGDDSWRTLAERARMSAEEQSVRPDEIIMSHEPSLSLARNRPAERAVGDWLIFLDADDQLDYSYIQAMKDRIVELSGENYLIQPSTLGVVDGVEDDEPVLIPSKDIHMGNWMVIGTAVRRDVFLDAGGFPDLPCWEDWALWARCIHNGAKTTTCPRAIYRVNVHPGSRNDPTQQQARAAVQYVQGIFR